VDPSILKLDDAPPELQLAIREFWPEAEWDNAARIAYLESGWNWDAEAITLDADHPCGSVVAIRDGITISAEWSIGYFQINACNLPDGWRSAHLFNARQNAGTAHSYWVGRGWSPWLFSARQLGLET